MRYAAVLFDIDGTLVDSNDAHAHAWVRALRAHGHETAFEAVRSRIGMGGDKLLQQVAGIDSDSSAGRAISAKRAEIFASDYLPTLRPTQGARSLVSWLKNAGIRITIATSATRDEMTGLLRAAKVDDLIEQVASSDDAESSKPDPDIVVAALSKSGCQSSHAIMLGDTPYDIEAASRAGVATIAFRTGGWPDQELRYAHAIFDDPEDLVRHIAGSPLGTSTVPDQLT
jgi:HAD superfamily hydrolase (TIGR01509 family)